MQIIKQKLSSQMQYYINTEPYISKSQAALCKKWTFYFYFFLNYYSKDFITPKKGRKRKSMPKVRNVHIIQGLGSTLTTHDKKKKKKNCHKDCKPFVSIACMCQAFTVQFLNSRWLHNTFPVALQPLPWLHSIHLLEAFHNLCSSKYYGTPK